jgi:hypothetical protein
MVELKRSGKLKIILVSGAVVVAMAVIAMVALFLIGPSLRTPQARIQATPSTDVDLDTLVTFDATTSKPRVAEDSVRRERYAWDFGDGQTAEGVTATHRFAKSGEYDVELRYEVIDSRNQVRQTVTYAHVSVRLPQLPPIVAAVQGADLPIWADEAARFDASVSHLSPSPSPSLRLEWTYSWDFGDGTSQARGSSVAHKFPGPGRYEVIVRMSVKDQFDREQTAEIRPRVVVDARPDLSGVAFETTRKGKSASVSVVGLPSGLGVGAYGWDIGADGVLEATTSTPTATLSGAALSKAGRYPVTIELTDPEHGVPLTYEGYITVGSQWNPTEGLSTSAGILAAGGMRLWDVGAGWSFDSLGITLLAQYGALADQPPDIDWTSDFPEVAQAGYHIFAHIESASFLGVTAHYPPLDLGGLGLVATVGMLSVEGQYEASCRVTINGEDPPVPFSTDTFVVGVGVGFRLGFGLISLQVLFGF